MRTKTKFFLLTATLSVSLSISAYAEQTVATIEERMNDQELQNSGLYKLNSEELRYLNQWLLKSDEKTPQVHDQSVPISEEHIPSAQSNTQKAPVITVEQAKAVLNQSLNRTIDGEFRGWSGKTQFKMTNGEIWRQRLGGKYFKKLDSPEVIIRKNDLGFYEMEILATGRKIGVTRLE